MYESPIERIFGEIQTKIIEQGEAQIMQAVQNCGVSVDKEELIKALTYDRNQYEKGYADAKAEQRWVPVSERLPEIGHNILISTIYGSVGEGEYKGFDGYHHKWIQYRWSATLWDDEVIAYMPLPEPYKGETDENNSRNTY